MRRRLNNPPIWQLKKARIAEQHATAKANDARMAAGQTERDQIMLASRSREAENAKLAAANSQAVANAALAQRQLNRRVEVVIGGENGLPVAHR
jgi:23S rRNA pseudoU1915 N3-methylase RlmH